MRPHASLPAVLCLLCVFVTPLRAAPAASPLDRDLSSERIAELTDSPIDIISTGPDRAQTIVLRHPFA